MNHSCRTVAKIIQWIRVCVCICTQIGDFNNRGTTVLGFILCTKPMRYWESNERSSIEGVHMWGWVGVCGVVWGEGGGP